MVVRFSSVLLIRERKQAEKMARFVGKYLNQTTFRKSLTWIRSSWITSKFKKPETYSKTESYCSLDLMGKIWKKLKIQPDSRS